MILSGSSFNRLSSQMMTVSAENDEVPEWVVIQMSTFTNWLNYQLRSSNVSIQNLTEDLADGTLLIQIVEIFQQRICTGKIYNNNPTEIQCLMNVQMALDALRESGIKLINIGSQDIVGKNLKLVLGLIWCLIQKYQIAITSKIPPKKLIMAWLQSVLPEFKLTNFRTSWNDGKALAALIDYCQPGLFSNWRELDPRNSFNNCQKCLTLAEKYLNVPALLNPEHLSSSELDELSTITYLSFFVAEGGPGYVSSLRNCSRLMPDVRVMDFDKSWNDGYLLCRLVQAVGGYIPDFEEMNFGDPSYFVRNMGRGLQAALDIGIASLLGPEDLADSDVEYLGIMALGAAICSIVPIIHTEPTSPHITSKLTPIQEQHYESSAIYSQTHPPTPPPPNTTTPSLGISTSCYQDQQLNLDLSFQHDSDLTISDLDVVVIGPNNRVKDHRTLQLSKIETEKGAVLSFVPDQVGLFQVRILCQGSELPSSPILLSVLEGPPSSEEEDSFAEHSNREQPYQVVSQEPIDYQASKAFLEKEMNKRPNHHHQDVARVSFSGLSEPCSVGSIVEVVINAQGTNESDECLVVESMSPSGKTYQCNISRSLHSYIATFSPNEVGSWHIGIFYNDDHIHGSPFACEVYDANKVEVYGLDVGLVGQELRFVINTQQAGHGHIFMNISKNGKSIPYELEKDNGPGVYKAMFIPDGAGQYKIGIKFNDCEIKGSSFLLDVADSTSFSVYGDNLKMAAVDRLSTFMIHASNAECKDITVFITGEHTIDVRIFGQSVYESPFICNVGDPELVTVDKMPKFITSADLGKSLSFEINAAAAGSGNLEIVIQGGRVPCRVSELGTRHFLAEFTIEHLVCHIIEMKFNSVNVHKSPWTLEVKDEQINTDHTTQHSTPLTGYLTTDNRNMEIGDDTSDFTELSGIGLYRAGVGEVTHFEITGGNLRAKDVKITLLSPSAKTVLVKIIEKSVGKLICEYVASEVGEHRVNILVNGTPLDTEPIYVSTFDATKVKIEPVSNATSQEPCQFVVDASNCGKGALEIAVNKGQVPNNVKSLGAGRCLITFIPKYPGTYTIDVSFNSHQILGCPIKVDVQPKQVGKSVSTPLYGNTSTPTPARTGQITSSKEFFHQSSGIIKQLPPAASPVHDITDRIYDTIPEGNIYDSVHREDEDVKGVVRTVSPKLISPSDTLKTALYESNVSLKSQGLKSPQLVRSASNNQRLHSPERSNVGYTVANYSDDRTNVASPNKLAGEKEGGMRGKSSHADIALITTSYETNRPSPREYIPDFGSKDNISTFDTGKLKQQEQLEPSSSQYYYQKRIENAHHTMDHLGTSEKYNDEDMVSIHRADHSDYGIQENVYDSTPNLLDITKINVSGFDEYGVINQVVEFSVRKREAGKGNVTVDITSPHGNSVKFNSYQDAHGDQVISYLPTIKGDYKVYIKANNTLIPGFPKVTIVEDERKPLISGSGLNRAVDLTEEVDLVYDPRSFKGGLKVQVSGPGNEKVKHYISKNEDGTSKINFKPNLPGIYNVNIDVNNKAIEGSPFKIEVTDPNFTIYGSCQDRPADPPRDYHFGIMKSSQVENVDQRVTYNDNVEEKRFDRSEEEGTLEPSLQLPLVHRTGSKSSLIEHRIRKSQDLNETNSIKHHEEHLMVPPVDLTHQEEEIESRETKVFGKSYDFGKSKFTSKHEVIKKGKEVEVKLEGLKLGKEDNLKINIVAPQRVKGDPVQEIIPKVKKSGKIYEISFKPTDVGTHKIFVTVNENQHPASPFVVRVYDCSEIIVGDIVKESIINDTVEFTVDAGRAGFGNLEMAIKDSDNVIIPSHVSQLESGAAKFLVTFNPVAMGVHTVNITFNKEILKGSPFDVLIVEDKNALQESTLKKKDKKKDKLDIKKLESEKKKSTAENMTTVSKIPSLSRVEKPASLLVNLSSPYDGKLEVVVLDSHKEVVPTSIFDDEIGVKRVEFVPVRVGDHDITVTYAGQEVPNSPFTCRAYDPTKILVGPIPEAVLDKAVHFVVDASAAGVGNLEVAVNEGKIPSMAHGLGQHKYDISFVPREEIDHTISIRFNNENIPGSPFVCTFSGISNVNVVGPGLERVQVGNKVHFTVTVDGPSRDELPVVKIVDTQGQLLPYNVSPVKGEFNTFNIDYVPQTVGNHSIEVLYNNNEPITFTSKAFDANKAKLTLTEEAIVGNPCNFIIDAAKSGAGNMEIIVSVNDKNVPNFVQSEGQAKFKVSFTPIEPKDHYISVKFNGYPVPGSPLRCPAKLPSSASPPIVKKVQKATDASIGEIQLVGDITQATVGKVKGFSIDAGGKGHDCNVLVTDSFGQNVPVQLEKIHGSFHVQFVPPVLGDYLVDIGVDGMSLPFCPVQMKVVKEEEVKRNTSQLSSSSKGYKNTSKGKLVIEKDRHLVGENCELMIEFNEKVSKQSIESNIDVEIIDNDGNSLPIKIKGKGLTLIGTWTPKNEGQHTISAKFNGKQLQNSPMTLTILDLSAVKIKGLKNDSVGVEQTFEIDWSNSGGRTISVSLTDEAAIVLPCVMKKLKNGVHACSFVPKRAGLYSLDVFIDDVVLPECPYDCFMTDSGGLMARGDALKKAQRGKTARFEISTGNTKPGELDVFVSDPNNGPVPVKCFKQQDEGYWVEFTPEVVGQHVIMVTVGETDVNGSPFHCQVIDPRQIILAGFDDSVLVNEEVKFSVQKKDAGQGEVKVEISDPENLPANFNRYADVNGDDVISFLPTKYGDYKVNVKMSGFQAPGYPKSIHVECERKPIITGKGFGGAINIQDEASIVFDPRKAKGGIKIKVEGPNNEKIRHSTTKNEDGSSKIVFKPTSVGLYHIFIDFNNRPIQESPVQIEVVDSRKVIVDDEHMNDNGVLMMKKNEPNYVNIDATAGGAGKLRVEIKNSKDQVVNNIAKVESFGPGKHRIIITPLDNDNYKIYLYWSNEPVPGYFPILATAKESIQVISTSYVEERTTVTKALEVVLRGKGSETGFAGEQSEFAIEFNGPVNQKELNVILAGSKADVPVRLTNLGNNTFKAVYVPSFSGNYTLTITQNGEEIYTASEPIRIRTNSPADRVIVDWKKLKIGIIEEEMTALIDTRETEPGKLSVKCDGPTHSRDIMLRDNMDGTYYLAFFPKELGKHVLSVKYGDNNVHVPGSPMSFNVSLPPDASKVKVYGNGIEHGILNDFKSDFIVETKGAGAGQLTIRVRGPRGAFNVEMQRDQKNDRIINCRYSPKEMGLYQVFVNWSSQPVPGSPFDVYIVDTHVELHRLLKGNSPSPQPMTPFIPPGWMGPPPPGAFYGHPAMMPPPPPHMIGAHHHPLPIPPHATQSILYSPNRQRHNMPR